jgi:enoyl-[acyl-carrier protein] reductase I
MTEGTGLMAGKRGLIMGVANDHSIAWGIADMLARHGATLAFTYQDEALLKRVRPLAESVGEDPILLPCDVSSDADLDAVFDKLAGKWGSLDFVVHAVAYSDKEELKGEYLDTTRANFAQTLDISCYSFTAVAQRAARLMNEGGSLITLTYAGAERVMPSYNVMGVAKAALEASVRYLATDLGRRGIRVNAISAGPMRTLAGAAIGGARFVYKWQGENSPLRRNITLEDVGGAGLYLLSDLSTGVTGEVHFVDSGYNVIGMVVPPG